MQRAQKDDGRLPEMIGSEDHIAHLFGIPHFELMQYKITFPPCVDVNEIESLTHLQRGGAPKVSLMERSYNTSAYIDEPPSGVQ